MQSLLTKKSDFPMNVRDLKKEQMRLAKKLVLRDDFDEIEFYGGVDQAIVGNEVISCVVVMDKSLKVIEKKWAKVKAPIQYIPGFLGFREGPAIMETVRLLEQRPDVLLIDGNGIAHPQKLGIASHAGIMLDIPSVGVAKKPSSDVIDGKVCFGGDVRAVEVVTKEHAKPVFVSPGHRVSMRTAERIVREVSVENHKMPEPIHEAHKFANKIRKKIVSEETKTE